MGYMQEIIRRGNVKYFISQKQEDVNKPVDNVGDIGAGSAWYVQEERPIYEQAVMVGVYPDEPVSTAQELRQSNTFLGKIISDKDSDVYVEDGEIAHNKIPYCNFFQALQYAFVKNYIDDQPTAASERFYRYYRGSSSAYDRIGLDFSGSSVTAKEYAINIEPYDNTKNYLDILDKKYSTKKARLGLRIDIKNKTIYFGASPGKIFLPIDSSELFNGSPRKMILFSYVTVPNGSGRAIRRTASYESENESSSYRCIIRSPGINFFNNIQDIFSDQKVTSCCQMFGYTIIKDSDIFQLKWSFQNVTNFSKMFFGAFQNVSYSSSNTADYWGYQQVSTIKTIKLNELNTGKGTDFSQFFRSNPATRTGSRTYFYSVVETIFVGDGFKINQTAFSDRMFQGRLDNLAGGAGTMWSASNPTDKTYAHWDEGPSNPGYFWNPNVMDPLVLVPGPQFNTVWLAAVNAAAAAAGSDRAPSIQQITGEFTFVPMSNKPSNLQTLSNNDVKESGDGEAYIGYTYNITDRSFKVYLVSDNIGNGNIKANPNCTDMFALDSAVPGSLTMNIEWLNTSQVTNMENMFGIKGV